MGRSANLWTPHIHALRARPPGPPPPPSPPPFARVAPEVLMGGQNCTSAVDLYSFGVVLWVRRSLSAGNPGFATHGPASLPGIDQQLCKPHGGVPVFGSIER